MTRRKLIAGNWKMHGSRAALAELDAIEAMAQNFPQVDIAICPPFTLIGLSADRARCVTIGGQDSHHEASGAHTGCVSATMLAEAGATLCLVGHSERRANQGEADAEVRGKATAVMAAGLTAILCVGETLEQRDAGSAIAVVVAQLEGSLPEMREALVVAYEPVWAIGTGRTPTIADVGEMHAAIRAVVGPTVRILYGGSVKASNAHELLAIPDVDGALVGGASLTAADFGPIVEAAGALAVRSTR